MMEELVLSLDLQRLIQQFLEQGLVHGKILELCVPLAGASILSSQGVRAKQDHCHTVFLLMSSLMPFVFVFVFCECGSPELEVVLEYSHNFYLVSAEGQVTTDSKSLREITSIGGDRIVGVRFV